MSFNIGPTNRPMIQESQSMMNNGGGGNTGYFQRGRKKKEEEVKDIWEGEDKVELSISNDENNTEDGEINGFGYKLLDKLKRFLK